jgi:hypothetical protein
MAPRKRAKSAATITAQRCVGEIVKTAYLSQSFYLTRFKTLGFGSQQYKNTKPDFKVSDFV